MPRLLEDILGSLFSDDDAVTIVRCTRAASSIAEAATLTEADVVIAVEQDAGPGEVSDLLRRLPHAQALAVADDARTGTVYELEPRHRRIELSSESVRSTIQRARRRHERLFEPRSAP
jgi:hypothetical protein